MAQKREAQRILSLLRLPSRQQSGVCAYSLLALLQLAPTSSWSSATNAWLRIHDMLVFLRTNYRGARYAENSRETFRKEAMHHFRTAALIEDNGEPTNSPNYRCHVTSEALALFRTYGTAEWAVALSAFLAHHDTLQEIYASKKRVGKVTVLVDGVAHVLSTGAHNRLQKAVVEEFAPRFLQRFKCLYLGDSAKRDLVMDVEGLRELGFEISVHNRLPDIVMTVPDRNWVVFVECVTSVGPMSAARVLELDGMTSVVTAGKVFITAFPNRKTYKKFSDQIAWETDVWIADEPDHMIHLNGDRFMGPHRLTS